METKEKIYHLQANILKALAHPIRIKIVEFLSRGEQCVCKIVPAAGGERTGVSKHLAILTKAGILSARKKGLFVYYSLKAGCVCNFLSCCEKVISEHFKERNEINKEIKKTNRYRTKRSKGLLKEIEN
ncbi:MAG: metalloregulator ArsR/SmtB family transcription factor [Candidatus Firestonebacteria bacterium]